MTSHSWNFLLNKKYSNHDINFLKIVCNANSFYISCNRSKVKCKIRSHSIHLICKYIKRCLYFMAPKKNNFKSNQKM